MGPRRVAGERHVLFCLADHFEPFQKRLDRDGVAQGGRAPEDAVRLAREWTEAYRRSAEGLDDADGRPPRHTFFYPAEEYDAGCLDVLAEFCREGWGEVEIHLHHRNDTAEGLRQKLESYRDTLRERHGLLGTDEQGRVRYGFVHGNWSLCNSRPDGDWCGVNEELGILSHTGCYADFTFPSAPSPTQPKMVNALYRAGDTPGRPRGHDKGVRLRVERSDSRPDPRPDPDCRGSQRSERRPPGTPALQYSHTPIPSSLLLVQGPLGLDWRRRKWGILPRLENAEISGANPPSPARVRLWVSAGIHVRGRPEWIFVKIHTHGCIEENRTVLFGRAAREMHETLLKGAENLHYVTAREMYNIARAAENGESGDPGHFRDYEVQSPFTP